MVQWFPFLPHRKKFLGLKSTGYLGPFCMKLVCSLWILQLTPRDMYGVRLIGDFKLAMSVNS